MDSIGISKYTVSIPIYFGTESVDIELEFKSCEECGALLFPDAVQKHAQFHGRVEKRD